MTDVCLDAVAVKLLVMDAAITILEKLIFYVEEKKKCFNKD